jgi:ribosomal subunit interface protein
MRAHKEVSSVDIVVKGRHTEVTERFRQHVVEKLSKIEKLSSKVIRVDVEVYRERNPRLADQCDRIELTVRSRGPVIRAEASAAAPDAALDLAWGRLAARLRKAADRRRVSHGGKTPVSRATATAPAGANGGAEEALAGTGGGLLAPPAPGSEGEPADATALAHGAPVDDGPMVLREKVHQAEPMTLDQALYEMELVGHDFFLFVDESSKRPSVVYRRRGYDYGVIRLEV